MGIEAVLALMRATPDSEALVVTLDGNSSVCLPLMQCVHKTQAVARAMATKNWEVAVQLRGSGFKRNLGKFFFMLDHFSGLQSTFLLLAQQSRVQLRYFSGIFRCRWDFLTVLSEANRGLKMSIELI